jgi:putative ATPase
MSFDEVVGQKDALNKLKETVLSKKPKSFLLWGPPGCGKTTLAKIYAKAFGLSFAFISAAKDSLADVKKIVDEIKDKPLFLPVILLVDELHRFNKLQQDYFLPYLEDGTIVLIGVTTENPSFAINAALLSRMRVLTLSALSDEELLLLLMRYEKKVKVLEKEEDKKVLINLAKGDGRYLLNLLDGGGLFEKAAIYDKKGEQHYNLISALHKSVRGSDPDAALYWLARMLNGGEDPLYVTRRIIRMATEDIGLADPEALKLAIAAYETYERLGSPEGELALAEAIIYLALAPKSNSVYIAYDEAKKTAQNSHMPPPKIILNAPTQLMKNLGYAKNYEYDHDTKDGFSGQNYFPDGMQREEFYHPKEIGFERELQKRKNYFAKLRENLK